MECKLIEDLLSLTNVSVISTSTVALTCGLLRNVSLWLMLPPADISFHSLWNRLPYQVFSRLSNLVLTWWQMLTSKNQRIQSCNSILEISEAYICQISKLLFQGMKYQVHAHRSILTKCVAYQNSPSFSTVSPSLSLSFFGTLFHSSDLNAGQSVLMEISNNVSLWH